MRTGWWRPLALRPAYSLLEVIVVVAILGTVVALTGPSVSRMVARQQVQETIRGVITDLGELRAKAYVQRVDYSASDVRQVITQSLPALWSVEVDPDLFYRSTGYCHGGTFSLIEPSGNVWAFEIEDGVCEIRAQNSHNPV